MKKIIFVTLVGIFAGSLLTGCISAREQQNPQPKKLREVQEWDFNPTTYNRFGKAPTARIEF